MAHSQAQRTSHTYLSISRSIRSCLAVKDWVRLRVALDTGYNTLPRTPHYRRLLRDGYRSLGQFYCTKDRPDEGIIAFDRARQMAPRNWDLINREIEAFRSFIIKSQTNWSKRDVTVFRGTIQIFWHQYKSGKYSKLIKAYLKQLDKDLSSVESKVFKSIRSILSASVDKIVINQFEDLTQEQRDELRAEILAEELIKLLIEREKNQQEDESSDCQSQWKQISTLNGTRRMNDEERRDLHNRVGLILEAAKQGRLYIAEHLKHDLEESILRIKYSKDDGLVIPDTVDSRIRAMSHIFAFQKYREDIIAHHPLREIQKAYFESLEVNFGFLFKKMNEEGLNPHQFARVIAHDQRNVDYITEVTPAFLKALGQFWDSLGEAAFFQVEDLQTSKAVFGGDLFPVYDENIASKHGLYIDTIVLPDPFSRSMRLFQAWTPENQTYYTVKHALNVLQYRDLALAHVDPPIVVVLPEKRATDEDYIDYLQRISEGDALYHAGIIFSREFESIDELHEYLQRLDEPSQLARAIKDPSRLLFDTEWKGSPEELIVRYMNYMVEEFELDFGKKQAGQALFGQIIGRMIQANDLLQRSQDTKGVPLIEAETSWRYFNWKLEYDQSTIPLPPGADLSQFHVTHALEIGGRTELQWIGNIPPDELIQLRKKAALPEIRELLGRGVMEMTGLKPSDFAGTTERVIGNIEDAYKQHQAHLEEIKRDKKKLFGYDIAPWLINGGLSIAVALLVHPALGVLSALGGMVGVPSLKDIRARIQEIRAESTAVMLSPMGLFFRYKK